MRERHARSMPRALERARQEERAREERHVEEPGANAATANFLFALSAAMPSAAVPMKKMYGKTMRVSATVRSNSPGRAW